MSFGQAAATSQLARTVLKKPARHDARRRVRELDGGRPAVARQDVRRPQDRAVAARAASRHRHLARRGDVVGGPAQRGRRVRRALVLDGVRPRGPRVGPRAVAPVQVARAVRDVHVRPVPERVLGVARGRRSRPGGPAAARPLGIGGDPPRVDRPGRRSPRSSSRRRPRTRRAGARDRRGGRRTGRASRPSTRCRRRARWSATAPRRGRRPGPARARRERPWWTSIFPGFGHYSASYWAGPRSRDRRPRTRGGGMARSWGLLGEQDLYLFNEGTPRPAVPQARRRTWPPWTAATASRFAVWAPNAEHGLGHRRLQRLGQGAASAARRSTAVRHLGGLRPRRRPGRAVQVPHALARSAAIAVDKADPFAFRHETPPRTGLRRLGPRLRRGATPTGCARGRPATRSPRRSRSTRSTSAPGGASPRTATARSTYRELAPLLADYVARAGLHARRAPAGHGAPVLRLVGLPDDRLLRARPAATARRRTSCSWSTRCTSAASA